LRQFKTHEHTLVQIQNSYRFFSYTGVAGIISSAFTFPQGAGSVPPQLEVNNQFQVTHFRRMLYPVFLLEQSCDHPQISEPEKNRRIYFTHRFVICGFLDRNKFFPEGGSDAGFSS
jgi:hypothetical protein